MGDGGLGRGAKGTPSSCTCASGRCHLRARVDGDAAKFDAEYVSFTARRQDAHRREFESEAGLHGRAGRRRRPRVRGPDCAHGARVRPAWRQPQPETGRDPRILGRSGEARRRYWRCSSSRPATRARCGSLSCMTPSKSTSGPAAPPGRSLPVGRAVRLADGLRERRLRSARFQRLTREELDASRPGNRQCGPCGGAGPDA